jgi:hypothetical protein
MASDMKSSDVQGQIATAVLKQVQDVQEQQAQALLQMMQFQPTLDGSGQIVNVGA